jgi:hypothetical protein
VALTWAADSRLQAVDLDKRVEAVMRIRANTLPPVILTIGAIGSLAACLILAFTIRCKRSSIAVFTGTQEQLRKAAPSTVSNSPLAAE